MNIIRFPGLIDIHVHLRDPGATHKEDFYSGTCAALAGGVTTVFDMPNKGYDVINQQELENKIGIATQKAVCDWGLYLGTDGKNTGTFEDLADKVVGLKIYLTSTTGHVLLPEELLPQVFEKWPKTKVIVCHIECEKTDLVLDLAAKYKNKIHVTHVSTKKQLEEIMDAKKDNLNISCDVTPHHLFLTEDDISGLKGFGMVKPPLSTKTDADFLWSHLKKIDCIVTDHAPHTMEEKISDNPPTGLPGLETMLPLLLTAFHQGAISIEDIIRLTNTNPQKIFGYKQDDGSYVEVDMDEEWMVKNEDLKTKCGWSQFNGWKMKGRVRRVFIRGTKAFEDGKILVDQGFGKNIIE